MFRIWRICERFPYWVKTPDQFFLLDPTAQTRLLAYELIREAEEWEHVTALAAAGR